jgi:hypothetical protein
MRRTRRLRPSLTIYCPVTILERIAENQQMPKLGEDSIRKILCFQLFEKG